MARIGDDRSLRAEACPFLVHDRDAKFSAAFDEVFRTEGISVIRTPVQAPNANAHAERFIRTVRQECLDWLLIVGRRQLERVLREYVDRYNHERPHRALELRPPQPSPPARSAAPAKPDRGPPPRPTRRTDPRIHTSRVSERSPRF